MCFSFWGKKYDKKKLKVCSKNLLVQTLKKKKYRWGIMTFPFTESPHSDNSEKMLIRQSSIIIVPRYKKKLYRL